MSQERAEDTLTSPPLGSSPLQLQVNQNASLNGGDDTESSQDSYPICLKCSKAITHVPYKYLGATFHAVCLKCNFCAKNLSAKPFTIHEKNIFCSNLCKANFEGAAAVTSESISTHQQNREKPSSKEATQSEEEGSTIFEVLDDIQEGNIELQKPPRRIPILLEDEPYRLTDYPARRNSHDSPSRRSSLSISAVSESSLTSEGSSVMSYDANKIPKKKILKHPHGQRKHSRNRVRFNLTEDESDNSSVYSFESMSTASEIYGRARSGVSEVMHGWKGEFEVSPPRGSTGLTPGKHFHSRNYHHHHHHHHGHHHPHHHHLYVRPDQRWSPTLKSTHSDSSLLGQSPANGLPSPNTQSLLGGSSSASPTHVMSRHAHSLSASDVPQVNISGKVMTNGGPSSAIHGLRRSTSPLASATFSSSDRHLQSTPLSHSHSESAISTKSNALNSSFAREHRLTVLKLNSSSIPELEESTLEDRKRGHIFQFPQNTPVSQGNISGQQGGLTSPTSHPNFQPEAKNHGANLAANRMLFADDDDADDYDHLSPLKNGDKPVDDEEPKDKEGTETKSNKAGFDDALPGFLQIKRIGKEKKTPRENTVASQNSQDSSRTKQEEVSQEEEAPPPVPKKLRSRVQSEVILKHKNTNLEVEVNKKDSAPDTGKEVPDAVTAGNSSLMPEASKERCKAEMRASNMASVSRAIKSSSDLDKLYFKQKAMPSGVNPREMQSTIREETEESKQRRRKKSKSPPPIPKKTTHIRRQDRDAFGNPLVGMTTLGYSSSSQSTNETNPSQETSASDTNIVPPPPEFSDMGFFSDPVGSSGPFKDSNLLPDDGLGASNSNTTLVSEAASELPREIQELPAGLSASKDISSSSHSQRKHKSRHKGSSQHDSLTRKTGETPKDVFSSSTRSGPTENQSKDFVDHGGNIRVKKMASESVLPSKSTKEGSNLVVSSKHTTETVTKVSQTLGKDDSASSPVITDRPNLKESKSNAGKKQSAPVFRRIPSRPAPPPPNRAAAPVTSSIGQSSSAANEKVTEEEKQALKLACPPNGSKLPMMAPTMHDTEKHIQDMMTEISIEQSRPNPMAFGMCVACTEPISSRKDFCSHEGVQYHINCFQCSRCATSLRGRTVLKIKSSLYCRDCYSKVNSSSGMRLGISHRVPQNKFHGPPGSEYYGPQSGGFHSPTSGGQITSV